MNIEELRAAEQSQQCKIAELERKLEIVVESFENLLNEISEPSWTDARLSYEERQITKGAVEEARQALELIIIYKR